MSTPTPPSNGDSDDRGILARALGELKRRKMPQTLALYAVGSWVVLQVAELAFQGLGIPETSIGFVWIGVFAGFPLVLVFAWRYQITSAGVLRTAPRTAVDDGTETLPLRRSDHLAFATLAVVAGLVALPLLGQIAASRNGPADDLPATAIAVLPLENITGDPDQEYLAAGLHDALVTALSTVSAVTVKAASSTRIYRNVVQPVSQTARELNAGHVVEGSVFRTSDRVRVNVRLIDARREENVWSEVYERRLEDILTLQNEVARAIAEQIRVELSPAEADRLRIARRVDPEVYETYLRGMYHLNQYTPQGVQIGLEYLREAVRMGPDDPLAHAGLAQGYTLIGHSADPPPGVFAAAREAAARALELDPMFAEAHGVLGEIQLYYDWDWAGAEASFRRALQLNPSLEFAHAHYAWYLQLAGDPAGAQERIRRAQQIAPVTPIFTAWHGWLLWADGQYERAEAEARKSLELNPAFPWALYVLGGAYAAQGLHDEAIATFERLLEVRPDIGRWGLAFTNARIGQEERAREVLAALKGNPGQKDVMMIGAIHAVLGDREEAIEWLSRAFDARVDWFPWMGVSSGFDTFTADAIAAIGHDSRYQALVDQLALPDR